MPNSLHSNKIIPERLESYITEALSFYLDLTDVHIEFKLSSRIKKSVMQAQPKFVTMHRSRKNRSYLVKISPYFHVSEREISIFDVPRKVLVGWIGHELGHIMDYLDKGKFSMIVYGLLYLSSKDFIIEAERAADTFAVEHGLGEHILATKNYILNEAGMSLEYIKRINKLYLPPEKIIQMMKDT